MTVRDQMPDGSYGAGADEWQRLWAHVNLVFREEHPEHAQRLIDRYERATDQAQVRTALVTACSFATDLDQQLIRLADLSHERFERLMQELCPPGSAERLGNKAKDAGQQLEELSSSAMQWLKEKDKQIASIVEEKGADWVKKLEEHNEKLKKKGW